MMIFVYGTLLRGEPNHRVLAGSRLVGEACTDHCYELRSLGPYPAMTTGSRAVVGEVYEVDEPTLARVDRLEGHPHFYRRRSVVIAGLGGVQAYLIAADDLAGRPVIESGSWRAHRKEHHDED